MELEDLPAEMLSHILESIDSPRALYRLISASSRCFRIFSRAPERILTAVLKNTAAVETIHHMLTVIRASEMDASSLPRAKLRRFLREYFHATSTQIPTTKTGLVQLHRLNTLVSGFMDDYFEKAMQKCNMIPMTCGYPREDSAPSSGFWFQGSSVPLRLSKIERQRLARAFLRFELYCRVFPVDYQRQVLSNHSRSKQSSLFLSHMTPYEVEEICCVQQYFGQTIRGFINDLKEAFVEKVRSSKDVILPTARLTPGRSMDVTTGLGLGADTTMIYGENLRSTRFNLFSTEGRETFSQHLSFLTSLGFQFVTELIRGNSKERADLIRKNSPLSRDFLPEALRHTPTVEPEIIQLDIKDDPLRPSFGYCTFARLPAEIYAATLHDGTAKGGLRALGYVFWDSRRILHSTLFNELNLAKSRECQMQNMPSELPFGMTAEQRLMGFTMTRSNFAKIEDEFGSTSLLFIHRMNSSM